MANIILFTLVLAILTVAGQHGFVKKPPSRAYLCQCAINYKCGSVRYEPQSVEAPKGFPKFGPVDKHIAGGGQFTGLDETGRHRWMRIELNKYLFPRNKTHVTLSIQWHYTAAHRTRGFHLFGTVAGYDGSQPLKRSNLRFIDYIASTGHVPYTKYNHTISKKRLHSIGTLLSIWDIYDTGNAFYQVIDYRYRRY